MCIYVSNILLLMDLEHCVFTSVFQLTAFFLQCVVTWLGIVSACTFADVRIVVSFTSLSRESLNSFATVPKFPLPSPPPLYS